MDAEKFDQLLRMIDIGNETAFRELYDYYAKKIISVAYLILNDIHSANDALDNVMIIIWNKSRSFKNIESPNALIYRMSKNAAIDIYRRINKKKEREKSIESLLKESCLTDQHQINEINQVEFLSLISVLEDIEKEIIIKKIVFMDTHTEIAKDLGLPIGTVKWKYQNILQKIKKMLK